MTHAASECSANVMRGDLDDSFLAHARRAGRVGWDIETSGLNWGTDRIGTCQVAAAGRIAIIVLDGRVEPARLRGLLESAEVQKIFHHAPFDLRFMTHQWGAEPENVACTKVASKLLDPRLDNGEHSLKPVLERHLHVTISKDQQVSDWLAPHLTGAQLAYAAQDVQHLVALYDKLGADLDRLGRTSDLLAANNYLPARVRAELRGLADVFAY